MSSEVNQHQVLEVAREWREDFGGTYGSIAKATGFTRNTVINNLRYTASKRFAATLLEAFALFKRQLAEDLPVIEYLSKNDEPLTSETSAQISTSIHRALRQYVSGREATVPMPRGITSALIESERLKGVVMMVIKEGLDEEAQLRSMIHELQERVRKLQSTKPTIPIPRKKDF